MIKKLNIDGYSRYYISTEGKVFKEKKDGSIVEVKQYKANFDFMRVNMYSDDKKPTTKLVHILVYEAFKGKSYSNIVFLDDDKENCRLSNLMSIEELRDFYNASMKKIIYRE